jgi:thioredoxin 1
MDELVGEFAGRAKVAKINLQEENAVAVKYGVKYVPTVMIFSKGQGRIVNHTSDGKVIIDKNYLANKLNQAIGS